MAPSNAVPPQRTPAPISEYVGLRALGMKPIKELPCLAPAIALLSTTSSPLSSCRAHKLPHDFTKPVGFLCRFSISQLLPPLLASSSPQIARCSCPDAHVFSPKLSRKQSANPKCGDRREEIGKVRMSERAGEHSSRGKGHTRIGLQPPHNRWTYP
jgi:hypothetical protein